MPKRERYRVNVDELSWPADKRIRTRLMAGERIPHDQRGAIAVALQGEVRDDLPDTSVQWLLDQGLIERVAAAPEPAGEEG